MGFNQVLNHLIKARETFFAGRKISAEVTQGSKDIRFIQGAP
jgi:hypothetical protein